MIFFPQLRPDEVPEAEGGNEAVIALATRKDGCRLDTKKKQTKETDKN